MNYATPIWMPNASNTSLAKLQIIQNKALRIATGCYTAASADHVHRECKILPVTDHLNLLSSQFLVNTLKPLHASHSVVSTPLGPRRLKETLQSKFGISVSPFLRDGVIPPACYKEVLTTLHTTAVRTATASLGPNRVLGTTPPEIHPSESQLPRVHQATLSQLHSGFCGVLKTYQHMIR